MNAKNCNNKEESTFKKMLHHHHHHEVSEKTVNYLLISFIINMILSVAEIIGGLIAGSVSLIGDALHNTSDAFSILIAVIAFKIGRKKADCRYTYGFKRAEVIGGFVNLILLFISGIYLMVEGVTRLISPQPIAGEIIIWISVLALIVDAATAKLSHHGSEHNTNMRMVFLHNLADALGSVGVIISGLCVVYFDVYFVDGILALVIASYMIYQAVVNFPRIVNILMNAAPENVTVNDVKTAILQVDGVESVHHLHIWCVNEDTVSMECHVVSRKENLPEVLRELMADKFGIGHCIFQVEKSATCTECNL